MRTYTLRYLTPRELDRDAALAWLRDEAPDFLTVLSLAFAQEDPAVRQAYAMLAHDARTMHEACTAALEGEDVELDAERSDLEARCIRAELARIVTTRPEDATGEWLEVYEDLGQKLCQELAA